MSSSKLLAAFLVVCLGSCPAAAQSPDEIVAARVLGPQWRQMVRGAGMIFTGTLTSITAEPARNGSIPTIRLKFEVERAIAGAQRSRMLTIYEWSGAWARQRPIHPGDHVLLLLNPPSKLGLTSPVNGDAGQVALDRSGKNLLHPRDVSVLQLERAIHSAREE